MGNPGRYVSTDSPTSMEGHLKTLCIGLVILSAACVGDDPDHSQPSNPQATRSPKIQQTSAALPEGLHTRLLNVIGTDPTSPSTNVAGIKVDLSSDWAMTVGAPELCTNCTLTLIHDRMDPMADGTVNHEVTVYDDAAGLGLCVISLQISVDAKTAIRADTCGTILSGQVQTRLTNRPDYPGTFPSF